MKKLKLKGGKSNPDEGKKIAIIKEQIKEAEDFAELAEKAIAGGVKQFIYASSGSVYGIKEELDVTEDLSLVPLSVYNKTKMTAERVLLSYSKFMKTHIIRPATVCGYSSRLRLDVSVNMLTYQALKYKKITVLGGKQIRPNLHIQDMIRIYYHFLKNKNISLLVIVCNNENIKRIR